MEVYSLGMPGHSGRMGGQAMMARRRRMFGMSGEMPQDMMMPSEGNMMDPEMLDPNATAGGFGLSMSRRMRRNRQMPGGGGR